MGTDPSWKIARFGTISNRAIKFGFEIIDSNVRRYPVSIPGSLEGDHTYTLLGGFAVRIGVVRGTRSLKKVSKMARLT